MQKPKINYIIDVFMAISFVIVSISGLVIFFFLPSGVQRGRYQEFLGITKSTWETWHDWSGIILVVLVLLHLILHWKWMISMTKNIFKKKEIEN